MSCTFTSWDAAHYLAHYYSRVEADEAATLDFITRACARIRRPALALAFGVGPTVHHLLPLAPHVHELHAADFLDDNLEHLRRWLRSDPSAHDWRAFGRHVLRCEGVHEPGEVMVRSREALLRSRLSRCLRADAGLAAPLFMPDAPRYDLIVSCYCAESATGSRSVWRRYLRNIVGLLAPGGLFVTAALRRCRSYHVGPQRFPCADIDEHDLAAELIGLGLAREGLQIEVHHVGLKARLGYDSILLAAGESPGETQSASGSGRFTWNAESRDCPRSAGRISAHAAHTLG